MTGFLLIYLPIALLSGLKHFLEALDSYSASQHDAVLGAIWAAIAWPITTSMTLVEDIRRVLP